MGRMKDRDFTNIKVNLRLKNLFNPSVELVRGLVDHAEAIETELLEVVVKYGQSEKNIDRLTDNVAQLKRENQRLMNEVDEAREVKKVPLPKEVAEALDSYFREGNDVDFIVRTLSLNSGESARDRLKTIKRFAASNGFEFTAALANGYTVEQTKEERLREGLKTIYQEWDGAPCLGSWGANQDDLVNRITDFVTKFNTENG